MSNITANKRYVFSGVLTRHDGVTIYHFTRVNWLGDQLDACVVDFDTFWGTVANRSD